MLQLAHFSVFCDFALANPIGVATLVVYMLLSALRSFATSGNRIGFRSTLFNVAIKTFPIPSPKQQPISVLD